MYKTKNYNILFVFVFLIILAIVGSFFDFELANHLYIGESFKNNPFGIIFAFIGIMPTFVGWSFLGASILYLSKKFINNSVKRRWLIALSVLLFILSFFFFCNTIMMVNSNAFSVHWAIAYPIGIIFILFFAYLGYKLSQRSSNVDLLKTVLFLTLISLIVMIMVMSTKEIMDRPRFRLVYELSDSNYFRNWWQSGSDLKNTLLLSAVSDEFSSFPSGHSAYSMFAIFIFPSICDYLPKLKKYRPLFFVFGLIWWVLTAFSRLTIGAHYLTDVVFAGLFTIIAYLIAKLIFNLINNKILNNKKD